MKKTTKRILSVFLTVVLLLGAVPLTGFDTIFSSKAAEAYAVGDLIQYGNYPQSLETDTDTIAMLDEIEKEWISYDYYSGPNDNSYENGKMVQSDYMQYADMDTDGDGLRDYRAVTFTKYRPECTAYTSSEYKSFQDNNGYTINNIYYFKYEPITWQVLDPSSGLIMSEKLLDSQAYNNYLLKSGSIPEDGNDAHWGDSDKTHYANNYYYSSIRKWLNEDFYNTAFTFSQASNIRNDVRQNNDCWTPEKKQYNAPESQDKIFLLSLDEARNTDFGFEGNFTTSDSARMAQGTDYSKCQGLYVYSSSSTYCGNSYWWLRTPAGLSKSAIEIFGGGYTTGNSHIVANISVGARPACRLRNLLSDITNSPKENNIGSGSTIIDYEKGDHIQYGNYPQSQVTDSDTLAVLDGITKSWVSYDYYSGTGSFTDGTMAPSDYMRYADIDTDGDGLRDYRAVTFTNYRPNRTGNTSSAANSYQDDNGYTPDNIYYFRYEPISWRVLEPSSGLIMSENILDSQAYNDFVLYTYACFDYIGDVDIAYYANNYYYSSIRKWLNEDFYNTAFTSYQANNIRDDVTLKNDDYSSYNGKYSNRKTKYSSQESKDKIFLFSYEEILNRFYSFSDACYLADTARRGQGTDYAKCQGLYVYNVNSDYTGNSCWRLRSPCWYNGNVAHYIDYKGESHGESDDGQAVDCTDGGIRMACRLNDLQADITKTEINNNNGSGIKIYCGSISSTDDPAPTQTVTLSSSDEYDVSGYYWGTNEIYTDNSFIQTNETSAKVSVTSPGTYYLTVKDADGNISDTVSAAFYKTTLMANGGYVSTTEVLTKEGDGFKFPTPTRSGYKYFGWSTSSTATSGITTLNPTGNSTYYAVWGKPDTTKPTGSITSTNNVADTQTVTLSFSDNVSVEGYYWGTSEPTNSSTYTSVYYATSGSTTETVSEPGTYYYSLKDADGNISDTLTVTFFKTSLNANGGCVSPASVLTMSGNSFTFPIPEKDGYMYSGWSTSSSATSGVKSLTPTDNTAYFAVWEGGNNIYNLGEETYSFENYADSDSEGHCFGMSATSSMYYLNLLDSTEIGCVDGNIYALSRTSAVSDPICYYQNLQGSYTTQAIVAGGSIYLRRGSNINSDWSSVINYVKDHSYDAKGSLQIAYRVDSMGGHAINFLRYEVVDGQERIYAYDNNCPNMETYFYQDASGKVWQTPYSTFGRSSIDCIALIDVSKYSQATGNYFNNSNAEKIINYMTHEIIAPSGTIEVEGAEEYFIDTDIVGKDYVVFEVPGSVDEVTITPLVDNASFTYLNKEYSFGAVEEGTSASFKVSDSVENNTATFTISIEPPVHTHLFDQKVVSDDYKATNADCVNAATYYLSCECGLSSKGTEGEATFVNGKANGHKLGAWHNTAEPTCTEKGKAVRNCSECSYYERKDLDKISHTYGEWKRVKEPTCTDAGQEQKVCTCGDKQTRAIAALGHTDANADGKCDRCASDLTQGCSCNCHKGGFSGFIWKILCFFYKLFGTNRVCACGKAHY